MESHPAHRLPAPPVEGGERHLRHAALAPDVLNSQAGPRGCAEVRVTRMDDGDVGRHVGTLVGRRDEPVAQGAPPAVDITTSAPTDQWWPARCAGDARRSSNGATRAAARRSRSTAASIDSISDGYATVRCAAIWEAEAGSHRRRSVSIGSPALGSRKKGHMRIRQRLRNGRAQGQLGQVPDHATVSASVLVEQRDVVLANPAKFGVLWQLHSRRIEVPVHLDQEVELAPRRRRVAAIRPPVPDEGKRGFGDDCPAGFLTNLTAQASSSVSPASTWPPARSRRWAGMPDPARADGRRRVRAR